MHACLSTCAACDRHVREGTSACPFCGAEVTEGLTRPKPARRLSRPGMLAFGAAVALGVGCGSSTEPEVEDSGTGRDAGVMTADAGGETDAGEVADDAGFDAGYDAGNVAMPYGAPPVRETLV